jgi:hypothetical protein
VISPSRGRAIALCLPASIGQKPDHPANRQGAFNGENAMKKLLALYRVDTGAMAGIMKNFTPRQRKKGTERG